MLEILLDPNVGYLLLVGGFVLAFLALFAPGTGFLEVGALFALLLAGYTLVNLPINGWAVILLLASIVPFVLALRRRKKGTRDRSDLWLLLAAIAALILGSIFVFRTPTGGPAVNPILAFFVSGGIGLLLWFMARKTLEAAGRSLSHNQDRVIGQTGTARTDLRPEGSVYVGGEEWSAVSKSYVPSGASVRIVSRQGLVLEVEQIKKEDK